MKDWCILLTITENYFIKIIFINHVILNFCRTPPPSHTLDLAWSFQIFTWSTPYPVTYASSVSFLRNNTPCDSAWSFWCHLTNPLSYSSFDQEIYGWRLRGLRDSLDLQMIQKVLKYRKRITFFLKEHIFNIYHFFAKIGFYYSLGRKMKQYWNFVFDVFM